MNFNKHSGLDKKHAFLSPSGYHWLNYDRQKLKARWHSAQSAARGTELHDYAQKAIRLGIRQPKSKQTIYMYINDCLGFKLRPEQPLRYSDNCFGTADAIGFRDNTLRIFDLKTGVGKTSVHQLEIYAAIFCLEYNISPFEIQTELRIYQNDEVQIFDPDPQTIWEIMEVIMEMDDQVEQFKEGADL